MFRRYAFSGQPRTVPLCLEHRQVIGYCHLENNEVTILMAGVLANEQAELPQPAWLSMGLSELVGDMRGGVHHVRRALIREVWLCSRAAHRA